MLNRGNWQELEWSFARGKIYVRMCERVREREKAVVSKQMKEGDAHRVWD